MLINGQYIFITYDSAGREADADLRAAATNKMECFVIIINDWKQLAIITKCTILDVAAALDALLERKNLQQLIKIN